MAGTLLLSDNGVSSGSTGYKLTGGTDGTLVLQTTTSGGTATNALTIDTSQNVSIGTSTALLTSSGRGNLTINGSSASIMTLGVAGAWFGYLFASGSVVDLSSNSSPVTVTAGGANYVGINTNGTKRVRVDSSGNVTLQKNISVGGATPTTSGTGITFPATQSTSTDVNTLDDYEEGTWTPVLSASPTAPTVTTYSDRIGYYTKIGNLVTVHCEVRATLSAAGTSGTARVTGLPFSPVGGFPAPAIGLRDLISGTLSPYMSGNVMYFDGGTYVTGGSPYIIFTVSYQV